MIGIDVDALAVPLKSIIPFFSVIVIPFNTLSSDMVKGDGTKLGLKSPIHSISIGLSGNGTCD